MLWHLQIDPAAGHAPTSKSAIGVADRGRSSSASTGPWTIAAEPGVSRSRGRSPPRQVERGRPRRLLGDPIVETCTDPTRPA